ncbi:MAG: hypothetical protein JRG80_14040 [Deltaproteobacteria bacterium]|nr:hypothetical protein [Deltaproteobacteria bacterium]MBW2400378.1 hypothetical protein [Deltaproteobacteria bacterium]MBW2665543.1 hypothetical protein [Deltaproteobacteria bacterium]
MMLRASVEAGGGSADLRAVTGGVNSAESRIPNGDVLIGLAEAVVGGDEDAIARARRELTDRLGPEALVDACGVIGNFERMVRIAESTGIPLDPPMVAITEDLRIQLGIDEFAGARNTPTLGRFGRMLGCVGRNIGLAGIRAAAALGRKGKG